MTNYIVDILTPDKVVATGLEAKNISVSTVKGEINILVNHTHFITKLFTGLLSVRTDEKTHYYSVENGICKILGNKITILSSSSHQKDQVNKDEVNNEISVLGSKLIKTDLMDDSAIADLEHRLEVLKSHLKLLSV
jgi:ATP synthase F1 epsilon subunit